MSSRVCSLETICVCITNKCNMSCRLCMVYALSHNPQALDQGEVVHFLRELRQHGLKHVSLSGGEPALYPDLAHLVSDILQMGLQITITTNGTSIPSISEIMAVVTPKNRSMLRTRVSIDGGRAANDSIRGVGSFVRAMREVERLKKATGWVGINTVAHSRSMGIEELATFVENIRIDEWAIMTCLFRGRNRDNTMSPGESLKLASECADNAKVLAPTTKIVMWDYISHPNGGVVLDWDGLVKLPGIVEEDDIIIGDFRDLELEKLWQVLENKLAKDPVAWLTWDV